MDIDESVPLPEKLTTPLPELPKMIPPIDGDPAKGVELPKKLTTPLPDKLSPPKKLPSFEEQRVGAELFRKELQARTEADMERHVRGAQGSGAFVPLADRTVRLEGASIQHPKSDAGFKADSQPLPVDAGGRPHIKSAEIPRMPGAGDVPPLRMAEDSGRPRIRPATIQRPVEESARLADSGFDLERIKRDAQQRVPNGFDKPAELPHKLRALGNREEKVFEPVGSSIPSFVASDNTQIKLSEKLTVPKGAVQVSKCGVAFEAPKMGEPMMRRVRIVWPTPMEKAASRPSVPLTYLSSAPEQTMKSNPPSAAKFPGQTLPTGAQSVQLKSASEQVRHQLKSLEEKVAKTQVPMPRRPEPEFIGLQSPPPKVAPVPSPEKSSFDEIMKEVEERVESLIKKTAGSRNMDPAELLSNLVEYAPTSVMSEIAKRAEAIMGRESKAKDLEVENEALREIVKTLGGKVALYEVEIQILKSKKG